MNHLFTPYKIKSITFKNRLVMAPMCMYSADTKGFANEWHYSHYETRADGGTGLILLEATSVEPRGRISENDLGIWDDAHVEGLREIVKRIHKKGGKAGIQLAHAGNKCGVLSEESISPSPLTFDPENGRYKSPKEMTQEDINEVITAFALGAKRAQEAGFDVIEIHGAHGYLINQFLSPISNIRKDDYGLNGTLFLSELISEVKVYWPDDKPLFLRISATDYHEDGNTPESLSKALLSIKNDIDLINVSSGGVLPSSVTSFEGYQVPLAEKVKQITELPVMAGGLIRSAKMADEIIRNQRADLVYLGRLLLTQPYWPILAAKELGAEIDYTPRQYKYWG